MNALRQEAEALRKNLADAQADNAANVEDASRLREQVATLERENSEQYAEAVRINKMHDEEKARADALAARISVLEQDHHEAANAMDVAQEEARSQRVRAEEAERRVAELEAERDAYRRDLQGEMDGAEALRVRFGARETETFPEFVERLATHPAPAGLLEAVGRVEPWARSRIGPYHPEPDSFRMELTPLGVPLTLGDLRTLLAAYDAAKGGEAREEGSLGELLALLAQPKTDTLLRVETEGGCLYSLDGAELHELAGKARKWDEACAQLRVLKSPEALGRVLQQDAEALGAISGIPTGQWLALLAWLERYMLGLDTPTPPTGGGEPKSSTVDERPMCPGPRCPMCSGEACNLCMTDEALGDCDHDGAERHEEPAPRARIAPPTTPEGPAIAGWRTCGNAACAHPPCPPEATHCTACGWDLGRSRMENGVHVVVTGRPVTLVPGKCWGKPCEAHPTVGGHVAGCPATGWGLALEDGTPVVPALAPVPGFAMPPHAVQAVIRHQAQPEPAAPETWDVEPGRLRVRADGVGEFFAAGRWRGLANASGSMQVKAMGALARALAEAKRELAGSVNPVALAAVRKTAAENMRERCVDLVGEAVEPFNDPKVRAAFSRLREAIRAQTPEAE